MTTRQIIIVTCLYFVALLIVIYFTRATARRIAGAFAGGAAVGLFGMGAILYGNALGLWRVPIVWTLYFLALFYFALTITVTPIYLVTWRVARRFGGHGLALCLGVVAIIGPPRDYLYSLKFPEWMVFAPGVSPIIADALTYIGIVAIGHAVMRLVAGPASEDRLRNKS
jgi:hypothetical protein